MTYRATEISQRDGSAFADSNCGMATAATAIDYHTLGDVTSTGAAMRDRQGDQSGGTDWYDAAEAWKSYGMDLFVKNGQTFDAALTDLGEGHLILLSVWHATVGGPCLSGSGAYGHGMAIAPERHSDGQRWLVGDPWCGPNTWTWWDEDKLRAGAEEFGRRVYTGTTGPGSNVRQIVRDLMNRWRPDSPALGGDADTGGASGGPILFAATAAHASGSGGGDEVSVTIVEDVWRYDPPRKVEFAAGATVNGYDPAKPNTVIVSHTFADDSSASFDAYCRIEPQGDPNSVPHGDFIRCASGMFEGLYVPARADGVTADTGTPELPLPETGSAYDSGWNDARAAMVSAVPER